MRAGGHPENLAALVLAAGVGKRMGAERAKVLHRLHGKTMLEMVLAAARGVGASPIVVVVGFDKEAVIRTLPGDVAWVHQKEQLGTGHAVLAAEPVLGRFSGDLLVLYGDVPLITPATLKSMVEHHRRAQALVTVLSALPERAGDYGRIVRDGAGHFIKVVEAKDASAEERAIREVNTGLYCFKAPPLFRYLRRIDNDNEQGEYYLTDVLGLAAGESNKVEIRTLADAVEALGVDTLEALENAERILEQRAREA